MPAWGAKDCRIGNNPFILAVPRSDGQHVMVDCALSQFSYGKLESTRLAGRQLPVPGGCDEDGQLTTDPAAIEKSKDAGMARLLCAFGIRQVGQKAAPGRAAASPSCWI